jgi:hypothetical protein
MLAIKVPKEKIYTPFDYSFRRLIESKLVGVYGRNRLILLSMVNREHDVNS